MINFSELVWRSGTTKRSRPRTDVIDQVDDIPSTSAIDSLPVEHAELPKGSRLPLATDPLGAGADRFRFLRMRLRELRELAKLRSLVITSPWPRDGKSTVAISLASVLTEGGKQSVLLVEADLHHPSLTTSLGLRLAPGLAECLESGLDPLSQVRKVEPFGWHFLSAGAPRSNPTELLQSDALTAVMRAVSSHFDWVLIDAPPVLPLTDALLLSRQVDATLLVARAGCTSHQAITQTINVIGKKYLLGIVLNGADDVTQLYSKYHGRYGKK